MDAEKYVCEKQRSATIQWSWEITEETQHAMLHNAVDLHWCMGVHLRHSGDVRNTVKDIRRSPCLSAMLVAARQSTSATTFTSVQSLQVARCRRSSVGGVGGRRRTLFWWLLLVVLAQPTIIVARGADDTKMLTTTGDDHYQRDRDLSDEGDVDEVHGTMHFVLIIDILNTAVEKHTRKDN